MMKILQISFILVLGMLLNQVHAQAPVITSLSPMDNAEGISPQVNLMMTFDMPIQRGEGTIEIRDKIDNSLVEALDVNSPRITLSPTTESVTIDPVNNLSYSTSYYVQVSAGAFENLNGELFPGILSKTFWNFSTGCSAAPVTLQPGFVSSNFVVLQWEGVPDIFEYQIWVSGKGIYNVTDGSNELLLTELVPGTTYSWYIKSVCKGAGITTFSVPSDRVTFKTTGTNPCSALPSIQSTTNLTDNSVRLNWSAKTGVSDYQVWISGLGTFYTNGLNYLDVNGLSAGSTYSYTLKARCSDSGSSTFSPAVTGQFTTTGTNPCNTIISNLNATTDENTAVLQWTANPGVSDYRIWVSSIGWITSTGGANTYPLFGLEPGTTYTWMVKASCSSTGATLFSSTASDEFSTLGQSACANAPGNPVVVSVAATSVTLTWDDMSTDDYRILLNNVPAISTTGGDNSYTVNGLQPGTTYTWAVKSLCSGGGKTSFSPYAFGTAFTTSDEIVIPLAEISYATENKTSLLEMDISIGIETSSEVVLDVYPNPSTDVVNVQLSGDDLIASIIIRDLRGNLVKELNGINQSTKSLSLREFGSGMYLIHIITSSNLKFDKKLIIQ